MKIAAVLIVLCVCGAAHCDEIDKAFAAQKTPTPVRADVDAAVQRQTNEARERVVERAEEIERRRQEDFRRSQSASSNASSSAPNAQKNNVANDAKSMARQSGTGSVEFVREFWQLANEMKTVVVRCGNGKERSYTFHVKTTRYCTPTMTCNSISNSIMR
jgi:hypothetical protein